MKQMLRKIKDAIIKMFFPPDNKCMICGKELFKDTKHCLCDNCFSNLPFKDSCVCIKCGDSITGEGNYCLSCKNNANKPYNKAFAPFKFKDSIVKIIHDLKYNNQKWIAPFISEFLVDEVLQQNVSVDVIIPIPLNIKRYNERGFNQSEIICEKLVTKLNMKVDVTSLVRSKYTKTQTNLTRAERSENLKDAFTVQNKEAIKGKSILLVDDVFTTGATMEEACKVLRKAGAKNIYCLTIAHVEKPKQTEKIN